MRGRGDALKELPSVARQDEPHNNGKLCGCKQCGTVYEVLAATGCEQAAEWDPCAHLGFHQNQ